MKSGLSILSLANVPEDPNAGVAGAEYQTVRALREEGHFVEALWAGEIGRRVTHGNLHYLLELPRRYERIVHERLSSRDYDVVQISQPHGYRAARLVRRSFPGTRFVHRSHGFEPRVDEIVRAWRERLGADPRPRWRRLASASLTSLVSRHNALIVRWAHGHVVCSGEDADYMVQQFGAERERVAVITHAPPDAFRDVPLRPMTEQRLRSVLYVGQFAFVKAPHVTAAAMQSMGSRIADATFTWVASREHHEAIRALFSPDFLPRLRLLDWMPQGELCRLYDDAGIFLFPSYFEGTGKASIEALSRGMCVIASNLGGMRDMIENGRTGFLVSPGDPDAVSARAVHLIENPSEGRRISEAAAAAAAEFTWARTARLTAEFYRRLIELPAEVHSGGVSR